MTLFGKNGTRHINNKVRHPGLSIVYTAPMCSNYILIDFENVQPDALLKADKTRCNVIVFVGSNQTKIPFELASSLQHLGNNGRYIKISGNGPNALDFHKRYSK